MGYTLEFDKDIERREVGRILNAFWGSDGRALDLSVGSRSGGMQSSPFGPFFHRHSGYRMNERMNGGMDG